MSMTSTQTLNHLTRAEIWSQELKDILQDELDAQKWVDWMSGEFPDGTQFNIPSIGEASVQDYVENEDVQFEALDTGEFTFVIDEYVSSGHYITDKAKQDSFYHDQLVAAFVPKQRRAIMEKLESDILKSVGPGAKSGGGQTAGAANAVNGYDHRYLGTGSGNRIDPTDFAYAKLALKKANVPMTNLVAIVDPTTAYVLETLTNIANVSNNAQWEGIITTGLTTGMRFIRNIYGFDVYESNYVADGLAETITHLGSGPSGTNLAQNLFFSADPTVLPIKGAWRQMPEVESYRNTTKKRDEYSTTARYGIKLYRPENMVCVLTDTTALS